MGQEDTCGVCGKHYQQCRHHRKLHISQGCPALGLCGGGGDYSNFARDSSAEDICKKCLRSLARLLRTDPQRALYVISENV